MDEALAKIEDPSGEGSRAYMKVYADLARAEADASDKLRAAGVVRSPERIASKIAQHSTEFASGPTESNV